jgi:hypothetical protein
MANDLTAIRASLAPGSGAVALSLGATIARQTAERKAALPNAGHARWTTGQLLAVSGVAAIALITVTLLFARQRDDGGAGDLAPTGVATPERTAVQDSQTATPPVAPAPAASEPVTRRSETARDRTIPDEAREAAVVSAVRVTAMKARSTASDAGVSETHLAEGDTRVAEADRLVRAKRYAEAVGALNLAMASWMQAERSRQTPGASASAARGDSAAERPNPTSNPPASNPPASPPISSAPPVVAPSPVVLPPSPRPEPPARSATVEITSLVLDYARAIESRDLARIKALYPDITAAQQRGFQQFFERVRGLRAALTLSTPAVDGNTATAQVNGAYDYTDAAGKPQRQPVTFRAVFRNNGTRWLIASVR